MKKNIFLLFIMALLFSGCYKDNKYVVKKPANLIPENKLASIIKEMDVVQGIMSYNRTHSVNKPNSEPQYYDALFKHFGVTSEQVRQSMAYYISLGKPMADIYDKVLEQFSIDESLLYEEQYARENNRLDSTGVIHYQFMKHWLYTVIDSTAPYSFQPAF